VRGGEEGELTNGEGREKGRWKMERRGEERESGRRNRRKG
jgi:hypothetical protein